MNNCFGLTLWAFHRRVELWVCFSEVKPHSHPGQHVEIVPLFGWAKFFRKSPKDWEFISISRHRWFRKFSIPAGWRHGFTLDRRPLVFLNITTGRSAADNFAT